MDKAIQNEQQKLAQVLKDLTPEERDKKVYGMMCWIQGHEAGWEAGVRAQVEKDGTAEGR